MRRSYCRQTFLRPEFSSSIYTTYPEEDIQLLCDVERFSIQYSLANDDERISSERYYNSIYGNDFSDAAIRKQMILKLNKISLSGDKKAYDSLIIKNREIYKKDCLNPVKWYGPIPSRIWSDIINLQTTDIEERPSLLSKV